VSQTKGIKSSLLSSLFDFSSFLPLDLFVLAACWKQHHRHLYVWFYGAGLLAVADWNRCAAGWR